MGGVFRGQSKVGLLHGCMGAGPLRLLCVGFVWDSRGRTLPTPCRPLELLQLPQCAPMWVNIAPGDKVGRAQRGVQPKVQGQGCSVTCLQPQGQGGREGGPHPPLPMKKAPLQPRPASASSRPQTLSLARRYPAGLGLGKGSAGGAAVTARRVAAALRRTLWRRRPGGMVIGEGVGT